MRLLHFGGRIVTQYMHLDEVAEELKPGMTADGPVNFPKAVNKVVINNRPSLGRLESIKVKRFQKTKEDESKVDTPFVSNINLPTFCAKKKAKKIANQSR